MIFFTLEPEQPRSVSFLFILCHLMFVKKEKRDQA